MIKPVLCSLLVLCTLALGADPSGSWKGAIELPNGKLEIRVELEKTKTWDGTISIPAQGLRDSALADVTVEKDSVRFAMVGIPGDPKFDGKLAEKGDAITGSFTQGPQKLKFALKRVEKKAGPTLEQRLERLSKQIEERRIDQRIPGLAFAVVQDGEVILSRGFGLANVEKNTPVTPETIFAIGSSTKAFTATAIGMLVDDGKMKWNDPLTRHLPEVRLQIDSDDEDAEATIRDLLSHRAGFARMGVTWASGNLSRAEVLATLVKAKPWSKFREEFNYCNVTYLAAGEAAAAAAGTDWDTLIAKRIFAPLRMTNSFTSFKRAQAEPRFSLGYSPEEGSERLPMRNIESIGPAGAINSNVVDMAKWVQFQLAGGIVDGKRLISRKQLGETRKVQNGAGGANYGLGWMLRSLSDRQLIEHGGSIDGFGAQVGFLPDDQLGYVLLTNVTASPLQSQVGQLVADALLGDWEEEEGNPLLDSKELEPYLGSYIAAFRNAEFVVQIKNGRLAVDVPGQTLYELKPPNEEGKWVFALTDAVAVSFEKDEKGAVVGMKLYQGAATFEFPRKGVVRKAEIDLDEVRPFLGKYRYSDDLAFEILVNNGRLAVKIPGQFMSDLHPPDDNGRWKFRVLRDRSLEFTLGDDGKVESMILHRGGQVPKKMPRIAKEDSDLPSVEEALALRNVEGRGAVFAKLRSVRATGTIKFVHAGVEGTTTISLRGMEHARIDMDLGKHGYAHRIFNGERGWVDSNLQPSREMTGNHLVQARMSAPHVIMGDWRKQFDHITVLKSEEFKGRKTHVIQLGAGDLPPVTGWIDAKDGTLHKTEMSVLVPSMNMRILTTTLYEDHREVQGLQMPWKSTVHNDSTGSVVTQLTKLEIDVALEKDLFDLPPK